LPKIVQWFIADLGINFLGINPLTDIPGKSLASNEYMKRFTLASIESFVIARKFGLYEDRMMRKVESFVKQELYPFDCAGCGRQIVVSPDGNIGVCHAYIGTKKYFSNGIRTINPLEESAWNEWSKRSPIKMPQCQNCPALGLCGGGCPYNADVNYGSFWALDSHFCIYSKSIIEWLIWDVYQQMGNK